MNKCKTCNKNTNNKVYCSEQCQHIGYKILQKESGHILELTCLFCNKKFEIKKSRNRSNKKYCSRKCCDNHKKVLQLGENNGMFGKKETQQHKTERLNKVWSNPNIRNNIKNSLNIFRNKTGYWPGTDKSSIKKRKQTFIKKYGVDHNWKVKEIRKKCNDTCFRLYGKYSWQILNDVIGIKPTYIEVKLENILKNNKIEYIQKYKIYFDSTYREYDFYIPKLNLLIECDGDFWHSNPVLYKEPIYEIQKLNKENDLLKNNLAKEKGYKLVRFWESDILKESFNEVFLTHLEKYD